MIKWDLVWISIIIVTGFVNTWQEIRKYSKQFEMFRDYILARDKCYQEMMIDYAKNKLDIEYPEVGRE